MGELAGASMYKLAPPVPKHHLNGIASMAVGRVWEVHAFLTLQWLKGITELCSLP